MRMLKAEDVSLSGYLLMYAWYVFAASVPAGHYYFEVIHTNGMGKNILGYQSNQIQVKKGEKAYVGSFNSKGCIDGMQLTMGNEFDRISAKLNELYPNLDQSKITYRPIETTRKVH